MVHHEWKRFVQHWFLDDAYLWDWLVALFIVRINRTFIKPLKPIERFFVANDPTLSYPLEECWLPHDIFWNSVIYGPAMFVALCQLRPGFNVFNSWVEWHHVQLSLAEAYAAACTMKHMLEHTGRYRPNFLARLATGDAKLIEDGASGYPSGHALYTFMTCILISCYLLGRFQVLAASTRGHYLKFIMCMLPIYLAVTESLERVVCYEHDYSDTLAGGCIGAAMGFLGYTLNFGSLFDPVTCGVPKVRSAWTMNEVDSVGGENEEDQRDYEEALLQGHTS